MSDASVNLGVANDGVDAKQQIGFFFPVFLVFLLLLLLLFQGVAMHYQFQNGHDEWHQLRHSNCLP